MKRGPMFNLNIFKNFIDAGHVFYLGYWHINDETCVCTRAADQIMDPDCQRRIIIEQKALWTKDEYDESWVVDREGLDALIDQLAYNAISDFINEFKKRIGLCAGRLEAFQKDHANDIAFSVLKGLIA